MAVRQTRIAGTFFPATQSDLDAEVQRLAAQFDRMPTALPGAPIAVIAPHAGYAYSGKLAAAAWSSTARTAPDRIAILSPSHHEAFDGLAVPTGHDAVAVPHKRVRIDTRACQALIRSGLVHGFDRAFETEHGIDTQLPFAHHFHPKVPVVPIVIGRCAAQTVARAIDRLARVRGRTLFILSSDLSHGLSETAAKRLDRQTAVFVETGQVGQMTAETACGFRALSGWLLSAKGRGARALRFGMHAASGNTDCVVGYGSWAFFPPETDILDTPSRKALLLVSRRAIASRLEKGVPPVVNPDSFAVQMRTTMACFVSLKRNGALRGCVGSLTPKLSLVEDVAQNAVRAAFGDRRFPALTAAELDRLEVSISVMSRAMPLDVADEADLIAQLTPLQGVAGVTLQAGPRRGLFLPSVWSSLPEPEAFLAALKRKTGLAHVPWHDGMTIETFHTEDFSDADWAEAAA
ncbi:AmmeMemoRadiSam system protein A [Primorskyibacter sp. 2E107]|uniref:AmmeMemoRadiSam system protein A n=1 Tax=Primorskyibacter sp. 2E107 TaxID=3403458 RepID=UPI003AF43EED